MRKPYNEAHSLLWIVGMPQCEQPCADCRDHPARIEIMRRRARLRTPNSKPLLRLCETCDILTFGKELIMECDTNA